jgi:hypothetical protein
MVRELPMMQYQEVLELPDQEFNNPLPKGPEAYGPDWAGMANSALTIGASIATAGMGAGTGGTFLWSKGLLGGLSAASGVPGLPNLITPGANIGSNSGSSSFLNIPNNLPGSDFGQAINLGQIYSSYNPLL